MNQSKQQVVSYDPSIYDVGSMREAMGAILGPEPHETVDQRWERETPYLGDLMERTLGLSEGSLILDYGCGVGRLSKEMIKRTGCRAVGVDTSTNMRALAAHYVDSPRFLACDATMLDQFGGEWGWQRFDAAIAVWVLQHCLNPIENITHIRQALRPGARFFVLNDLRLIPTEIGFVNDHLDVTALLAEKFKLVERIELPLTLGQDLAPRSHCAVYEKY